MNEPLVKLDLFAKEIKKNTFKVMILTLTPWLNKGQKLKIYNKQI